MSDQITALVRTWAEKVGGFVASYLIARLALDIDETTLAMAATAVITGVYYTLITVASRWVPAVQVLLGKRVQPTYQKPADA